MTWNLQNIRGTRETVKAKIAAENIQPDVKAFIGAQIDSLPSDVLGCVLNGYCQDNARADALKLTRNIQITIECARV
jgi:hypothetical protein